MTFIYYIFVLQACATALGEQAAVTQEALPKEVAKPPPLQETATIGALPKEGQVVEPPPPVPEVVEAPPAPKIVESPPVAKMVEPPPPVPKIMAPPPVPEAVEQPGNGAEEPSDDAEEHDADQRKEDDSSEDDEQKQNDDDADHDDDDEDEESDSEDEGDGEEPRKRKRHEERDDEEEQDEREEERMDRARERRQRAAEKRAREKRRRDEEWLEKQEKAALEDKDKSKEGEIEVSHFVAPKATVEPDPVSLTRVPLLAALLSFAGILAYSLVFICKIFRRRKGAQSSAQKATEKQSDDLDFEDLEGALEVAVAGTGCLEEPATPVVRKMVQSQEVSEVCTNGWDNDSAGLSDAGWGDASWEDEGWSDAADCEKHTAPDGEEDDEGKGEGKGKGKCMWAKCD